MLYCKLFFLEFSAYDSVLIKLVFQALYRLVSFSVFGRFAYNESRRNRDTYRDVAMSQKPKIQPLRRSPVERFDNAEQQGDLIGFVRTLDENPSTLKYSLAQKRLLGMIEKRLKTDRAGLLADLLDNSLSITGWCLLRMNQLVIACLEQQDSDMRHTGRGQPSNVVLDVLLPKILDLSRQILDIEQTRVGLERQRELARAKKLENDRLVKTLLVQANDDASDAALSLKSDGLPPLSGNSNALLQSQLATVQ